MGFAIPVSIARQVMEQIIKSAGVRSFLLPPAHFRVISPSMARPRRLEFAHGLCHVTSRGDGREDIYREDVDRELFLEVLSAIQWAWWRPEI